MNTALFQLGFRPFFLLATLAGTLLLALWLFIWSGGDTTQTYYPNTLWHAHEMLFGYTSAVIAGFLLTSVRNWTGMDTATGLPLLLLALLWVAGRLTPLVPILPAPLIALIDLAFLPAIVLALAKPLWLGKNTNNRVFILVIGLMTIANVLQHLEFNGYSYTATTGLRLMQDLILLLILLISGRVLPFFTNMAIPGTTARQWPTIEKASMSLMALLLLSQQLIPYGLITASLAIVLAVIQTIRLYGWYNHGIWQKPVLWVLYSGYAWIIVSLALMGLSSLGLFPSNLTTHAFTIGVISVFTFGMMARVSLGHTGRAMQSANSINIAFVLLNIAAVIRVFLPFLLPTDYPLWINLSGGLWILSFIVFLTIYTPILLKPRIDGKAG